MKHVAVLTQEGEARFQRLGSGGFGIRSGFAADAA